MDPSLPDEEHGGLVEDSDDEVTPESTEVFDPNETEEQEMTAMVKTAVEKMIATDLNILAEAMIAAGRQSSPPEPEPDVPPEPKPDVQPPPLKKTPYPRKTEKYFS